MVRRSIPIPMPEVVGIVEDDGYLPKYLNGYKGKIFLLWSTGQDTESVVHCPDWPAVFRALERLYGRRNS